VYIEGVPKLASHRKYAMSIQDILFRQHALITRKSGYHWQFDKPGQLLLQAYAAVYLRTARRKIFSFYAFLENRGCVGILYSRMSAFCRRKSALY